MFSPKIYRLSTLLINYHLFMYYMLYMNIYNYLQISVFTGQLENHYRQRVAAKFPPQQLAGLPRPLSP